MVVAIELICNERDTNNVSCYLDGDSKVCGLLRQICNRKNVRVFLFHPLVS